ncbi:MAG: thiamine-phosphate kinase [Candidatus Acidiferrales bacterium]
MIERARKALAPSVSKWGTKGSRLGIGDDAAILTPTRGKEWVLSCDFFLEGIHFLGRSHPPESVGYKSLARAASDLAAMGAEPRYFLLSMALPASKTSTWLDRFLMGMRRAVRSLDIELAGGDTSRHPSVAISITVVGEVEVGRAVYRSGARPGDLLYVSGALGAAQLALELILRKLDRRRGVRNLLFPHLYPSVRIDLGRWLAQNRMASAMMDISDGLSTDLARMCAESGVGARVFADRVPSVRIPPQIQKLVGAGKMRAEDLALHGGEDYELLFTVQPRLAARLRRAPGAPRITRIGEITRGRQVLLMDNNGGAKALQPEGWDPFRKKQAIRKRSSFA